MHNNNLQTAAAPDNIPVVLTIPECAKAYNLPPYALRRWVKTGALKAVRSGKKIFINTDVLNKFLQGGGEYAQEGNYGSIRVINER